MWRVGERTHNHTAKEEKLCQGLHTGDGLNYFSSSSTKQNVKIMDEEILHTICQVNTPASLHYKISGGVLDIVFSSISILSNYSLRGHIIFGDPRLNNLQSNLS